MAATKLSLRFVVAWLLLAGCVAVMAEECPKGKTTDTCKSIGTPEVITLNGGGRRLFHDSRRNNAALPSSDVPNLSNRRSLLQYECSDSDSGAEAVMRCTNAVRKDPSAFNFPCGFSTNGRSMGDLTSDSSLIQAAQLHSQDNARMGDLSHTGSDGSRVSDRVKRAGYDFNSVRENIAYGYTSARDVVSGWMCSSGHRDNILSCDIADIGVGVAEGSNGRLYHTQVFACPRGGSCSCSGGGGRGSNSPPPLDKDAPPSSTPGQQGGSPSGGSGIPSGPSKGGFPSGGYYRKYGYPSGSGSKYGGYPSGSGSKYGGYPSGGGSTGNDHGGRQSPPGGFFKFFNGGQGGYPTQVYGDYVPGGHGNDGKSGKHAIRFRHSGNGVQITGYLSTHGL